MTPTDRIDIITTRLRRRPACTRTPPKRIDWAYRLQRAAEARRWHEEEREAWERYIEATGGCVRKVAVIMGYEERHSRAIIWDLGLWPLVVEMRREASNG